MTDKQIIIDDYFNIMCDENGRILGIQEIGDQKSLIKAIKEQNEYIQAKEQELQQAMDNYVQLDLQRVKEYNELVDLYKAKEQECEQLKTWFIDEQIDNDKLQQFYQDEHCDNLKLKKTITEIKEIIEECYYKCNSMNNCNISCKYYNNCNGEFSYLLAYLNKQISEVLKDE